MENIILALTFVYGPLRLLTFTKLFNQMLAGPFNSLFPLKTKSSVSFILHRLDTISLYVCLFYQLTYWVFK